MIQAVVTDIEGTTTSLSFVQEVLFPYAGRRLAEFVYAHSNTPGINAVLEAVWKLVGKPLNQAQSVDQLLQWQASDQKVTPLKTLQGMIWQEGYARGDFKGHVYPDVVPVLQRWCKQGKRLYVFSSGSIQAQQLLFKHTEFGDITPLFSDYFDTHIGSKRDVMSYRAIAAKINTPSSNILFLSDIVEELDAARTAGLQTCWLVRNTKPIKEAEHRQVASFTDIDP